LIFRVAAGFPAWKSISTPHLPTTARIDFGLRRQSARPPKRFCGGWTAATALCPFGHQGLPGGGPEFMVNAVPTRPWRPP
jgi:hypothetical protein